MSDSELPPPSSGSKPGLSLFPPGKEDGQSARIEKTTGALQIIKRPVRIEGEIVGTNRDGTVRIHTDQGDLDVRLRVREGQSLPQEGSRIEIDIAPGRPPRQAVIRAAPPAPTPEQMPEDLPSAPQAREQKTETTQRAEESPPRPGTIPLPVAVPPEELPLPLDVATIQKPLNVSDVVRLLPLPPEAEHLISRPIPDIIQTVVITIAASADLIATKIVENAQDDQVETLLRLQLPAPDVIAIPESVRQTPTEASLPAAPPVTEALIKPVETPPMLSVKTGTAIVSAVDAPLPPAVIDNSFTTPLPLQPIEVALEPVPAFSQKQISVQTMVLAEEPLVQMLPPLRLAAIQLKSAVLPQMTSTNVGSDIAPAAQPSDIAKPDLAAFRLLPTNLKTPAEFSEKTPTLQTLFFTPATLPATAQLHHFPVALPAPKNTGLALPEIKTPALIQTGETLSVRDKPAIITVKPQAVDIFIVTLPPPAVKVIPVPPKTHEIAIPPQPGTNPFLTETTATPAPVPTLAKFSMTKGNAVPSPKIPDAEKIKIAAQPSLLPANPLLLKSPATAIATIVGKTVQNLPVLSMILPGFSFPQNFVLQFNAANLPVGTIVEFMPQPGAISWHAPFPADAATSSLSTPANPLQLFGDFAWPVMDELQQILQQQQEAPQAFETLARTAPNPGNPVRMPAAALFFLAAVRAGDFAGWLGEKTTEILRRAGRNDIIARAGRDFAGLQRSTTDPISHEWRAMALPLVWQNDLHKMMLYYRRNGKDENGNNSPSSGTRFIFDLNLSRMGSVQLDGLHRQGQKRLDLIVRTLAPIGQSMQQSIRKTWVQTLDQTNLHGEISFQNKPEQFVKIPLPASEGSGFTA